jgi:ADP-ribose pyrophosphatase
MIHTNAELSAYNKLRKENPEFFVNRPGTAFEFIFETDLQCSVGAGLMHKDAYIIILRDAVRFRNGTVGQYMRTISAVGSGSAAALPIIDDRIILIRHERHATREIHWEIPRGFVTRNEAPEETARREIVEEIGIPEFEIVKIGSVHPDTGMSNVRTQLYLARLIGVPHVMAANEGIDELKTVTIDEFDAMLRADEITDSFTLAAVLQARVRGLLK